VRYISFLYGTINLQKQRNLRTHHSPRDKLTGTVPGQPMVDEPALKFQ